MQLRLPDGSRLGLEGQQKQRGDWFLIGIGKFQDAVLQPLGGGGKAAFGPEEGELLLIIGDAKPAVGGVRRGGEALP